MMKAIVLFLCVFIFSVANAEIRARRQSVIGQSAVATPDGGVASVPAGSQVLPPNAPVQGGIQTDPNRASVVALPGGGLQNIPPGSKVVPPEATSGMAGVGATGGFNGLGANGLGTNGVGLGGVNGLGTAGRKRRQIVTGQSAVATPDGGVASIPAGSQVLPPNVPVPGGIQTDPNRASVVALPGGGLQNIQPGSKVVPPGGAGGLGGVGTGTGGLGGNVVGK